MHWGPGRFAAAISEIGAILRYAVNDRVESIDLEVAGLILMIVGVIGLVLGAWQQSRADRVAVAPRDRY